ncbi:MAG: polyprenyl synthetase family protein [Proteobacteria bacterium]|nr:polyprenyl synthetase family protein [Pseudomonadota bacterium]MDA1330908.1 polyprenyl synthetase family protein [Pseudomonadota bacterium]
MSLSLFEQWRQDVVAQLERSFDQCLPRSDHVPTVLHEAMHYAVKSPGKRIRSLIVCASADLFGSDIERAIYSAVALELIHTYSLVHDDLPCMDNDDLRRGQPTVHIAFDEATAMLVGDALQPLAFNVLSTQQTTISHEIRLQQIHLLSEAAGSQGMVGGQAIDLAQVGLKMTQAELELMHSKKTGALFLASAQIGALCGLEYEESYQEPLCRCARHLGLGFQVTDDILDVSSPSEVLGKSFGKDLRDKKPTYVTSFGLNRAKELARELAERTEESLMCLPRSGGYLSDIAKLVFNRVY